MVVTELKQVDQKYAKKIAQIQEQHELVRRGGRRRLRVGRGETLPPSQPGPAPRTAACQRRLSQGLSCRCEGWHCPCRSHVGSHAEQTGSLLLFRGLRLGQLQPCWSQCESTRKSHDQEAFVPPQLVPKAAWLRGLLGAKMVPPVHAPAGSGPRQHELLVSEGWPQGTGWLWGRLSLCSARPGTLLLQGPPHHIPSAACLLLLLPASCLSQPCLVPIPQGRAGAPSSPSSLCLPRSGAPWAPCAR